MPYVLEEGETDEEVGEEGKDYYYDKKGNKVWFNPETRIVKVKVSKEGNDESVDDIRAERDRLQSTLESLAEAEFEKAREELKNKIPSSLHNEVDYITTPEELQQFEAIYNKLSGLEPKRQISSGVVGLLPKNKSGSSSLASREFDSVEDMIGAVYRAKREGDVWAREAVNTLWKRVQSESKGVSKIQFNPKIRDPHQRYVMLMGRQIPEVDAKALGRGEITTEQMIKRIESGYYG